MYINDQPIFIKKNKQSKLRDNLNTLFDIKFY